MTFSFKKFCSSGISSQVIFQSRLRPLKDPKCYHLISSKCFCSRAPCYHSIHWETFHSWGAKLERLDGHWRQRDRWEAWRKTERNSHQSGNIIFKPFSDFVPQTQLMFFSVATWCTHLGPQECQRESWYLTITWLLQLESCQRLTNFLWRGW